MPKKFKFSDIHGIRGTVAGQVTVTRRLAIYSTGVRVLRYMQYCITNKSLDAIEYSQYMTSNAENAQFVH